MIKNISFFIKNRPHLGPQSKGANCGFQTNSKKRRKMLNASFWPDGTPLRINESKTLLRQSYNFSQGRVALV
jgi:hypothetical protein